MVFEINLRKEKRLFLGIHKPPSLNSQYFLVILPDLLDFYSNYDDNKVILTDLTRKQTDPPLMMTFLNKHDLIKFIKYNTCFKREGSYIELILTILSGKTLFYSIHSRRIYTA